MEVETEIGISSSPAGDLITALEQATLMAKQLPITTDPSNLHQIHTALRAAQRQLSLFLHPPPPPQFAILPSSQPENSVSSAVGDGEPMETGDDEDDEHDSPAVETVEGRLRECSIRNKRRKRQLCPSAAGVADRRRSFENLGGVLGYGDTPETMFDPVRTKLRSLDLIYQFHA